MSSSAAFAPSAADVRTRPRKPSLSTPTPSSSYPPTPPTPKDDRPIATSGSDPKSRRVRASGGLELSRGEYRLLAFVVLLALFVRLWRLGQPSSVVFDEVHFGGFASKYIKSKFFMDVHPPLAKLLITLAGFIAGYNGDFAFKDIGDDYLEPGVPYVAMRFLPAILGVALVPLAYLTLRALHCRVATALLGALLVTFENGLITQSRLILLDSPLIFFTALAAFFWTGFANEDKVPQRQFKKSWWTWLTLTGLALGAVTSCKWVGLFTIATVGLATIRQLWYLLGDLRIAPRLLFKHFCARALGLIVVPIVFYMLMFEIHFLILSNSGSGDGFMSSEFQHTLRGHGMKDTSADVAVGSKIAIRHLNTQGGYLHSHVQTYPSGSMQQQVTLYPHRDDNNLWRIFNASGHNADNEHYLYETSPLVHITDGMLVRFEHVSTEKRLHSHDIRPPVSEVDFQNEVSAYGFPGFAGDANDNWRIEIYQGDAHDRHSRKRLRAIRTKFRLKHTLTGCYLFSHKVKLPDWGFEQQEVTCNKNPAMDNSIWYIETNEHPLLNDNDDKVNYRRPSFLSKFLELNAVMWRTNAGLTDRHAYDSRPWSWPILRRGINFWVKEHRQVYLIGNPVVWWLSTLSVALYAVVRGLLILRAKRGYKDFNHSSVVFYDEVCGFLFIGWAFHYAPFFLMNRQLFLHHYFPALYFAILLTCAVFDFITATFKPRVRLQAAAVVLILVLYCYAHFSPLAYGNQWTRKECQRSKWLKTWDFSCGDFPQNYAGYETSAPDKASIPATLAVNPESDARARLIAEENAKHDAVEQARVAAETTAENTHVVAPLAPGHDVFAQPDGNKLPSSSGSAAPAAPEVDRSGQRPSDAGPPLVVPEQKADAVEADKEGKVVEEGEAARVREQLFGKADDS